jgi:hypothetical protein
MQPARAFESSELPFAPSNSEYEHAARLLCRFGRVPGIPIRPIDFRVLVFLTGQQPGIVMKHKTIGAELDDLSHDAVHDALHRLKHARLVRWELIPPKQRKPWGSDFAHTTTNMNRYYLTRELLDRLAQEEAARARRAHERKAAHEASGPMRRAPQRPAAKAPDLSWAEPAIQELAQAFDRLALRPPCRAREATALRNRLGDGCSLEELLAAVQGAGRANWRRRDGSSWARDPFAIVFRDAGTVRRFAEGGAGVRNPNSERGSVQNPDAPRDGAACAIAGASAAHEPSSSTAGQPSSTRSQDLSDRDPPSKTTTAGAGRSEAHSAPEAPEVRSAYVAQVASETPGRACGAQVASETPGAGEAPRARAEGMASSGAPREHRRREEQTASQPPALIRRPMRESADAVQAWLAGLDPETSRVLKLKIQERKGRP